MGSALSVLTFNHQKKGREKENKISPLVYEGDIFNYFGNSLQHTPSEHFLCRRQLAKSYLAKRHSRGALMAGGRDRYSTPKQTEAGIKAEAQKSHSLRIR